MNLVAVGSVAYDSVETLHGKRDEVLGGSATFFSLASKLFADPGVVAVVGEDFRQTDIQLLKDHGVDLAGLTQEAGRTFRWKGRYHDDMVGRDTLQTELNVFEAFDPKLPDNYRDANFVFLGNIHPSLQDNVLDQVTNPRFVGLDTMNLWIDISRDALKGVLDRVDALFVNDEEAMQLTGATQLRDAANAIHAMGPSIVVIKRGSAGAILFHADDTFICPAFLVDTVIDPTGAGDTFAGGFMGHLARTQDLTPANLRRATAIGSVLASFCVEGFSVDALAAVTPHDLKARYQHFMDLTAIDSIDL